VRAEGERRHPGEPPTCASGISPSGPVHLGNLRELMVPHLVADEVRRSGAPCRHILSWDDYDRLRRVPAGFPEEFAEHIGRPLTAVPDPCGGHPNWAEHFKAPLLDALDDLGVQVTEISQTEMYTSGAYTTSIITAMRRRADVDAVLARYRTKKSAEPEADDDEPRSAVYYPFRPYCDACGRDDTTVTAFDDETTEISYTCACGASYGPTLIAQVPGKLVWKVDWPMRWAYERVTFEPAGVDHSSPGSSFTVGGELVKAIFGGQMPLHFGYSFVGTSGSAKMSGSRGGAPTPADALEIFEAPLLRWLYARRRPEQSITLAFDAEVGRVYDEWDALTRRVAAGQADATSAALLTGSLGQLLLAGVWVGLAFQAKMIQAWLALPALAAAYLLAAPAARLRTRWAHVALAGLVTAVVSLSWMTAVSLVPSQDRPYVDGSANDSLYTQVFDYNGLGRLTGNWARVAGPPSPLVVAAVENGQSLTAETFGIKASWHRLLAGPFAADSGWLLPAAVAAALGVLISRRRQGRRDPLRAAVVLWGGWWLILAVFFSVGTYLNSYYVAALIPAVAALCGTGIAACGPRPWPARLRLIVAATVLGCAGYGAYLVSGTASGPVVLTAVALIVAVAAAAQLLLSASGRARQLTAVAFAGAAVLVLPASASVSCVIRGLGPFDTPFESSKAAHVSHLLAANGAAFTVAAQRLSLHTPPGDALFATDTSGLAANYILYGGREVLPIGGYLGNVPAPTLATLQADIGRGYVEVFVLPVSPPGPDPRVRWIESHCTREPPPPDRPPVPYANFFCGGPHPLPQPANAATGAGTG